MVDFVRGGSCSDIVTGGGRAGRNIISGQLMKSLIARLPDGDDGVNKVLVIQAARVMMGVWRDKVRPSKCVPSPIGPTNAPQRVLIPLQFYSTPKGDQFFHSTSFTLLLFTPD